MKTKKQFRVLKTVSFLLVFTLLLSPLSIHRAQAQSLGSVGGLVAGLAACTSLSNIFGGVSGALTTGISSTVPVADSVVRDTTAEIQGITGNHLNKECSLDTVAYAAAKFLAESLTNNVLNFIQTDFDGGPAFITDPSDYFLQIAEKEAKDFIYYSGSLNNIYRDYQPEIRLSLDEYFTEKTGGKSYAERAVCNLDQVVTDPSEFRSGSFGAGGWGAWLEATQNPYCNPYGLRLTAREELDRRLGVALNEQKVLADWGSGVQSVVDSDGKVTTPGSVISAQLNQILGQGFEQLNNADELSEVMTSFIGDLTGQIFSRSGLVSN